MPITLNTKLSAFRRSPKGFFLTLEVDPIDSDWKQLGEADLGTPFAVVMQAYNAETGKRQDGAAAPEPTPEAGEAGRPRKHWHEMSRAQQAGILCADPKFQGWLASRYWDGKGNPDTVEDDAASFVRTHCSVHSRADLDKQLLASERFDRLVAQYRQDTGLETAQR